MAIGSLLPVLILTISPYSACHSALGCRISSKLVHLQQRYDVISIFKMAAAAAQFYFRFQIRWRRSFSDASFYQHSRYNYFRFGKTNVCHTGILLPVLILTISPYSACHSALGCRILSKSVHPQRRYDIDFEVGGRCGIILLPISDRRMYLFLEVSISKPNVVVITQPTAEIYLHHIGIILPVSISTISPQSTSHSSPVCQISSKSDRSRHKNDVMSIFKLADFRHLGF